PHDASITPSAAFRGRESTRSYKRMCLAERIVFSITRMVLANRTSRNLFAAYCLALHILLFVMLYMMSTAGIEQHTGLPANVHGDVSKIWEGSSKPAEGANSGH